MTPSQAKSANAMFRVNIVKLIERSGARADVVVKKVVLDLTRSFVMKSPVDTGRFRGNWQCGLGSIDPTTTSPFDGGGTATVARAASKLSSWVVGERIYITNALPYARRLEYGWSKQAPQGMVRRTMVKYGAFLREAVKGLK